MTGFDKTQFFDSDCHWLKRDTESLVKRGDVNPVKV